MLWLGPKYRLFHRPIATELWRLIARIEVDTLVSPQAWRGGGLSGQPDEYPDDLSGEG
jgi:hypothetical protein